MTDVSLSNYIKTALKSSDGVIRESSNDGGKIVNKGTLGHRMASVLRWGDSETRGAREERALQGFKKALIDRFGTDIAQQALREAGLDGEDVKTLTSEAVLKATGHARQIVFGYRLGNKDEFTRHRSEGEAKLDSELQKFVFRQHYRQEFVTQSKYGLVEVGELSGEIEQRTVDRIKAMSDLDLVRATNLRPDLDQAMVSLMKLIDRGVSSTELLAGMAKINDILIDLARVEHVPPEELDEWSRQMYDYSVHTAMTAIGKVHPDLLFEVQRKALSDDAPLRGLYDQARDLVESDSGGERIVARDFMDMCESLVRGLSRRLGPRSNLEQTDEARLKEGGTLSSSRHSGVIEALKAYCMDLEARPRDRTVKLDEQVQPEPEPEQRVREVPAPTNEHIAPELRRGRDDWIQNLLKVPQEPEDAPLDEDDERKWAMILRERSLKSTMDKPILQYMLDTGCSVSTACDVFHDLLHEDEAFSGLVGFLDRQTLIDAMVEIEETGMLREGPRRLEVERQRERVDMIGQFYDGLLRDFPGISNGPNQVMWEGSETDLQREVARRVRELVANGADVDVLCEALRNTLNGMEGVLFLSPMRAIGAGLDLVQRPTAGARLVRELVAGFDILDGQEGAWRIDDLERVIRQHVVRRSGELDQPHWVVCEDIAKTLQGEGLEHELHPDAMRDIFDLLKKIQQPE